ncbi:MAG: (2,3-dihydroxybenzoyl)adenylate synthase [Moraxellaceae bacterium]|nr:MAG: (2,3-dihydroxybenzoyl)adenylate synthase [Moraxellaceae bacterium]
MTTSFLDGATPWPEDLAARYRAKKYWLGQTIGDFLQERAQQYGSQIALICGERQLSYAVLDQQVNQFASALQQQGFGPNDRVVIQLPNIAEFFIAYFASIRLGMLPIMALPAHRLAEISSFTQQTQACLYICADRHLGFDYRQLARQCQQRCPSLKQVIVVGAAQEFLGWQSLLATAETYHPVKPAYTQSAASQVAFFQLSGGSTGTPKLIPRTHDDYLYSVRASAAICPLDTNSRMLMVLPAAHNFSLSSPGSLGILAAGGTVVLAKDPAPSGAFALIRQHQISHVALVPALAVSWTAYIEQTNDNALAQLKTLQVGGARLPDVLAYKIIEHYQCPLQQVFGMAEGLVNYTRHNDSIETIVATQGRPISPDDEIRVVDDDDQEVTAGEIGHLLTRGPYTIRGYYRAEAHNANAFTSDGFYRTGDLVRLTSDGNIVVEGRSKDQINRGGEKIATEEVEQALAQHSQVLQAALVAMPDAALGEKSCAYIVWRNDIQNNKAETLSKASSPVRRAMQLRQFLQDYGLATFKIPDRIEFIDQFPFTALGKIDKKILRQRLLNEASVA